MKKKRIIFIYLILHIVLLFSITNATSAASTSTSLTIGNIAVSDITETSASITFTIDQIDARTLIHYGTNKSMSKKSNENTDISLTRTIVLSDLSKNKSYYYSIYAYNRTNSGQVSHSPTDNFRTLGNTISMEVAPNIGNISVGNIGNASVSITFTVDQIDARTLVRYGKTTSLGILSVWDNSSSLNRNISLSNLSEMTNYSFSIRAYNSTNNSLYTDSPIKEFITVNSSNESNSHQNNITIAPKISSTIPEKSKHVTATESINFTISFDDTVNVTWYLDNTVAKTDNLVSSSYYEGNTSKVGTYNVTASGSNRNGTVSYSWSMIVDQILSGTGNRIWDGSRGMSNTYMWNSFSFAGFYYDIDNNMSTEELIIKDIKRTIDTGDIIYTASPQDVEFAYDNFGKYQVVGFMANKYFAGYRNSTIPNPTNSFDDISTMSSGQLHKVLIDDDTKRTISVGGTISLQDGYVIKATDIDLNARTMMLSLLKDGSVVDSEPLNKDETYVYKKSIGGVNDIPIILVRFDNVFSGNELQTAFIKGIFQISEDATSIKVGDRYKKMEVSSVGNNKITMTNRETIGLSPASKIDLMGDLKIIVADDSDTLRFSLSVKREGAFDVRGTVYPMVDQWTPMNFGLDVGNKNVGFYYDLDEDIGTENLKIDDISGSSIPIKGLTYSTSPQQVSFAYDNFGKYQVVGFMADKYFAGYKGHDISNPTDSFDDISTISQGQLHKVLMDDDTKRTISVGGTLSLQDGYVIKASDIDLNGRIMMLTLLKDGTEVDSTPLKKDETYVYRKRIGNVESLPLILVRFDNVFAGGELQAAFLKGIFQISENPTSVKVGDGFGNMEVDSVSSNSIIMKNKGSIGLSRNNIANVMSNIKIKVADSGDLRFYPFVSVDMKNMQDIAQNQLVINVPNKITGGDTIDINVTAGGIAIGNVSISVTPDISIPKKITNNNGIVNITLPKTTKGMYTIIATRSGYEKANKTIDVKQYIENILSIDIPIIIDQFEIVPIKVTSNGNIISDVTITYDDTTVGSTDNSGVFNYKLDSSGAHTITVSKTGYTTASRDIDIRAPFSEFKTQDINITTREVFTGDEITILADITNTGTKEDTRYIDLIVDGKVVGNESVLINKKDTSRVSFNYKVDLSEGNYTVEVLGQSTSLEVKKRPINVLSIATIFTVIGIIIVFLSTTRQGKGTIDKLLKMGK